MLGNRALDTRPEIALRSILHRRGFRFRKHSRVLPDLRCRPDVAFPRERVAVFIDGCFWHGCPEHASTPKANAAYWRAKFERNQARDARNDSALRAAGWQVVRAWEHEPAELVADRIAAAVSARRAAHTSGRE
jgi:DNA mismatch endonuclease (patch repair protein)